MGLKNCWEIKNCGRESGGSRVDQLGVCPAASDMTCNGVNGGVNGGRACWAVAGTLCHGEIQGTFAQKRLSCYTCEVYRLIKAEAGESFELGQPEHRLVSPASLATKFRTS